MKEDADQYLGESYDVSDLKAAERTRCVKLIANDGAVNMTTALRDFPRSARIAVARKDSEVVGVASIKPIREDYATGVADKPKFVFDSKTPELGYVVVGPGHRNHGLSSDMAARCSRRLPTLR